MARSPDSRDRGDWPPNVDEGQRPDSRQLRDHGECLNILHEGERTFQEDVKTRQYTPIPTQSCSRFSSGELLGMTCGLASLYHYFVAIRKPAKIGKQPL